MDRELKKYVERYLQRGWSPLPVNITTEMERGGKVKKIPHFPAEWKSFQSVRLHESQIEETWKGFTGLAIATGRISGITVIDIDVNDMPEMANLPLTYRVKTRRGFQYYYQYDKSVLQTQNEIADVDIRNDGGLVFAPPTTYTMPDGTIAGYKVLDDIPLAPFPIGWYSSLLRVAEGNKEAELLQKKSIPDIVGGVGDGTRNISAASMAGSLLRSYPEEQWKTVAWPLFCAWNAENKPPLDSQELERTWKSIAKAEYDRRRTGAKIGTPVVSPLPDGYQITFLLDDGSVIFEFVNYESTSTKKDVTVSVSVELPDKTKGLPLVQRFNLLSVSTKSSFISQLNQAFGKTYNWTLLLSQAVEQVVKANEVRQDIRVDFTMPFTQTPFLLFPFVEQGSPNMFFGMGDNGKTFLSLAIGLAVAFDREFLGHQSFLPAQTFNGVLFIDYENSEKLYRNRLKLLAPDLTPEQLREKMFYLQPEVPFYDFITQLKEYIAKHQIGLLIIDSVAGACGGPLEESETVSRFFNALRRTHTTSLLIAHQSKSSDGTSPFGSVFWYNQIRNSWNVKKADVIDDSDKIEVMLKHQKHNNFKGQPDHFAEIVFQSSGDDDPTGADSPLSGITIQNGDKTAWADELGVAEAILDNLRSMPMTTAELVTATGRVSDTVRKTLHRLQKSQKITKTDEKRDTPWVLAGFLANGTDPPHLL